MYPLDQFAVDELVLARNVNREQPFWPVSCSPYRLFQPSERGARTAKVLNIRSFLELAGNRRGSCQAGPRACA